jgi:hypothetical protein
MQKVIRGAEEMFGHANVQLSVLLPRKVQVGKEFEIRLDLVNISRSSGKIVEVEDLIPLSSKVTSLPSFCKLQHGLIEMNQKEIEPFEVETIKLRIIPITSGTYKLEPKVLYLNDLGEIKKAGVGPITMTVKPSISKSKFEIASEPLQDKFESDTAEKAFNFLINAFEEDYARRKLPHENSGWRTLTQVAKGSQISMFSLYGRNSRGGKALSELTRLGVVESRFFLGERGRGGRVLKVRIQWENKKEKQSVAELKGKHET